MNTDQQIDAAQKLIRLLARVSEDDIWAALVVHAGRNDDAVSTAVMAIERAPEEAD